MAARSASYVPMMEMEAKSEAFVPAKPNASLHRASKRVIALVVLMGVIATTVVILQFYIKRSNPSEEARTTRVPTTKLPCTGDCTITMVESIPRGVKFPAGSIHNPSTYDGWMHLMKIAKKQLDIASFYWTLRGSDTNTSDPSTEQGDHVFEELQAIAKRGINVHCTLINLAFHSQEC